MHKNSWINYTKKMDKLLEDYRKNNLITALEMTEMIWIRESTFYTIKRRKKIGVRTLKKIKDKLWIDLIN